MQGGRTWRRGGREGGRDEVSFSFKNEANCLRKKQKE